MWSPLSENLQRKNGQNCGGWGNRTPLKSCRRDEPASDCLGCGEKAGQVDTSRHHRRGDTVGPGPRAVQKGGLRKRGLRLEELGWGDMITFWQGIPEPPQWRREQQRGRKEGKERVTSGTVQVQNVDSWLVSAGHCGLTDDSHGASLPPASSAPRPLWLMTSCSLVPSPISLPHPGTRAGKDAPQVSWVACSPWSSSVSSGCPPLSLHQLFPQPLPHLFLPWDHRQQEGCGCDVHSV